MKTLLMVMALVLSFNVIAEENLNSDCAVTRDDLGRSENAKANMDNVKKKEAKKATATIQ